MPFTPINPQQKTNSFTPISPQQTVDHGGIPLSIGQQLMQGAKDIGGGYLDLQKKSFQVAGDIASKAAQPFVSLAATPVQALAKATGQPDPYAQGVSGSGINIPVSNLSLEAKGGDVLKAGAEIGGVALNPTSLAGTIGAGALVGGAQAGGTAMQQEQPAGEVAKQTGIGAAIGGVTAGIIGGVSKLIGKIGEKIQSSVIRPTQFDVKDGFKIDTIKKYDLGGNLNQTLEKTQTKMGDLTNQLNEKLGASPEKINLASVYEDTLKELTGKSKLKGFGANSKIASSLEQLKSEIDNVGSELSIPDAQIVKQASGGFGAWQYEKVDPESKASEMVYNTFYTKLKNAIESASPEGVREINKQLSELIPVLNATLRRIPVAQRNNLISLSDMVGLIGSSVNPVALGPTLLNLISKSGVAANMLMKSSPVLKNAAVPAAFAAVSGEQAVQGSDKGKSQ